MKNFERVQSQVEDGSMRIINVEAIPRAVSTALSRALSESEGNGVYINEPFNRMQYDIEAASGHILKVTDPIMRQTDEPLTVVTKNMARNLSLPLLREWLPVCEGNAWSIRNPRVQISSLLTRVVNDLTFEAGADQIKQGDLTPEQIKTASDWLENGPKSTNFSKTSWADISGHFRGCKPEHSVVIDGGELTTDPHTVLAGACAKLGLVFSSSMIEGWQGDFNNANGGYNDKLDDKTHAWTREAASSVGIMAVSRSPLDMSVLPDSLQSHLNEVAIPTYQEMMNSNR